MKKDYYWVSEDKFLFIKDTIFRDKQPSSPCCEEPVDITKVAHHYETAPYPNAFLLCIQLVCSKCEKRFLKDVYTNENFRDEEI